MNFEIFYDNQPKKFLKNQDNNLSKRILDKIDLLLPKDPVPHNSKRIVGYKTPVFRIRIGDYRVLYRINYDENRIIIIKIDRRSKVY